MTPQETKGSLREILATNHDLRQRAQLAAAQAAYKVIREAGIIVSADDIAAVQRDVSALMGTGVRDTGTGADPAETLAAGAVLISVLYVF